MMAAEGVVMSDSDVDRPEEGAGDQVEMHSIDISVHDEDDVGVDVDVPIPAIQQRVIEPPPALTSEFEKLHPHRIYRGNNTIACNGLFVLGPQKGCCFIAELLILFPILTYILLLDSDITSAYGGATLAVLILPMLTLARVATTDPGIVKRYSTKPVPHPSTYLQVTLKGMDLQMKYCDICLTYRPPRCRHCHVCDNCVEVFDHHCPWTGTCIGRGNYQRFIWFLLSLDLAIWWMTVNCYFYWMKESRDSRKTPAEAAREPHMIAVLVLLGYLSIAIVAVGGITLYHLYLICTGQSTREHLRNIPDPGYKRSKGCFRNFIAGCCGQTDVLEGIYEAEKEALDMKYPSAKIDHSRN